MMKGFVVSIPSLFDHDRVFVMDTSLWDGPFPAVSSDPSDFDVLLLPFRSAWSLASTLKSFGYQAEVQYVK